MCDAFFLHLFTRFIPPTCARALCLQGIQFPEFTLHLFIGIVFCTLVAYGLLSAIYWVQWIRVKNKDPPHIAELKREVVKG